MSYTKRNARRPFTAQARVRLLAALSAMMVAVLGAGCIEVGDQPTYPIEIFSEMHYSQAYRAQESPRHQGVESAVAFEEAGVDTVVEETAAEEQITAENYDVERAGELYRVNCSVCHGVNGLGDGPATQHITWSGSRWADVNGEPYNAPPDLLQSRTRMSPDATFGVVTNGIQLMPEFGPLLSDEERWQIVRYLFDEENGLGSD